MANFKTAMFQANLLYGTDYQNEDDFLEVGLIAYNMIGNKNIRYYRFTGKVDEATLSLDLPCNCDYIESVTIPFAEFKYYDGTHSNGNIQNAWNEAYIESRKVFTDPIYGRGKYVHYERIGDKLYFQYPFRKVLVIYEGQYLDDEGLPELNDKEIQAIATYAAYISKFKEGLRTNNKLVIEQSQLLKQEWNKYCDQARSPEHIDQNDMNDILEAKSSWDRKWYGLSHKPAIR